MKRTLEQLVDHFDAADTARHETEVLCVRQEAERLVAFLSERRHWNSETRRSNTYGWTVDFRRMDSVAAMMQVRLLVRKELDTETLMLKFDDVPGVGVRAEIVPIRKMSPPPASTLKLELELGRESDDEQGS